MSDESANESLRDFEAVAREHNGAMAFKLIPDDPEGGAVGRLLKIRREGQAILVNLGDDLYLIYEDEWRRAIDHMDDDPLT